MPIFKFYLAPIFFILIIFNCYSQQLIYSKYYFSTSALNPASFDLEMTSDNHFLLSGTSYPFHGDTRYFLAKIDAFGDTVWYRTGSPLSLLSDGKAVVELSNGNYAISSVYYTPTKPDAKLTIIDANGFNIVDKVFTDSISIRVSRHFEYNGNIFLFCRYGDSSPNQSSTIIIRTDIYGDSITSRIDSTFRIWNDQKSCILSGNNFYMTGFVLSDSIHPYISPAMVKLDENGNEILRTAYYLNNDFTGTQICQTSDNGFAITVEGSTGTYLLKVDSLGQLQWQQQVSLQNYCLSCPPTAKILLVTGELSLHYFSLSGNMETPMIFPVTDLIDVTDTKFRGDSIVLCGFYQTGSSPLVTKSLLAVISDSSINYIGEGSGNEFIKIYPTYCLKGSKISIRGVSSHSPIIDLYAIEGSLLLNNIQYFKVDEELKTITIPNDLRSGIYILSIFSESTVFKTKIIIF